MQRTENYRLFKPESTDNGSPEPFNNNADVIDTELNRLSTGLSRVDNALVAAQGVLESGITSAKVSKLDALPTSTQLDGNLSSKANKSDITNINITGTTNNTGSNILAGTLFYLNGALCKALVDVANGATFTEGTNYQKSILKASKLQIDKVFAFTSSTEYKRVGSITIPAFYSFGLTAQNTYDKVAPNGVFFSDLPNLDDYSRNAEGKRFSSFEGLLSEPITLYVYCKEASAGVNTSCRLYGWMEPLY